MNEVWIAIWPILLATSWTDSWNTAQWVVTFSLSGLALVSAIWAVVRKVQKKRDDRIIQEQKILSELTAINNRLIEINKERTEERCEDAYIRTRSFIGQVAILDAIMRLASHQGLEINGEIAEYRKENIQCLKNGTGIAQKYGCI